MLGHSIRHTRAVPALTDAVDCASKPNRAEALPFANVRGVDQEFPRPTGSSHHAAFKSASSREQGPPLERQVRPLHRSFSRGFARTERASRAEKKRPRSLTRAVRHPPARLPRPHTPSVRSPTPHASNAPPKRPHGPRQERGMRSSGPTPVRMRTTRDSDKDSRRMPLPPQHQSPGTAMSIHLQRPVHHQAWAVDSDRHGSPWPND